MEAFSREDAEQLNDQQRETSAQRILVEEQHEATGAENRVQSRLNKRAMDRWRTNVLNQPIRESDLDVATLIPCPCL